MIGAYHKHITWRKIAVAGKQAWVDKAEGLIDTSKYVHEDGSYYSQQEIRELL